MGNLWLKIKVWTKVLLFAALAIYVVFFIAYNSEAKVKPWFWFRYDAPETSVLRLVLFAFLTGVVGTLLVRTTFVTLKQMREMRQRSRTERMQREIDDMKAKAAKLRTKPVEAEAGEPEGEG